MRECSKRILELARDRQKLKAERADSISLKKRIQGEGKDKKNKDRSKRKYVIDEDAFYNQKEGGEDEKISPSKSKEEISKRYDRPLGEPNLAKKLGLDDEAVEKSKEEKEKEKNRKKTKEELEKEKEIDEVRQIIENDSHLNKYIKEVDLLAFDIDDISPSKLSGNEDNQKSSI